MEKKKKKVLALVKTQKEKHRCIQAHEENRSNFQRTGKTTSEHKSAWKGNAHQYGNAPLSFCTEQSSTLKVTLSPPPAKQMNKWKKRINCSNKCMRLSFGINFHSEQY